ASAITAFFSGKREAIHNRPDVHIAEMLTLLHPRAQQHRPANRMVVAQHTNPDEPLVLMRIKNVQHFGASNRRHGIMTAALAPYIVRPAAKLSKRFHHQIAVRAAPP